MFDRFTAEARKAMGRAREEAVGLQHEYVGTEHILLGLLAQSASDACSLLRLLDVDAAKVNAEIGKIVQNGPAIVTMGQIPFTPRAKKVLELAVEDASTRNMVYIDTVSILHACLKENEGVAAQVLKALGLTLEKLKDPRVKPTRTEVDPTVKKKPEKPKAEAGPSRTVTKLDYFKEVVAQQIDAISCNGERTLVLSFHAAGGGQVIGLSFQGYGEQEDES